MKRKVSKLFISDLHLGAKDTKVEELLKCLQIIDSEEIYLVGDIIDGWRLECSWRWPKSHNDFVRKILKFAKTRSVFYITGNHDEFLRNFAPIKFGDITIINKKYIDVGDKRYLVIHGDQFDGVISQPWIYGLGAWGYNRLVTINLVLNKIRKLFGKEYWSFSAYVKSKVKHAAMFLNNFEEMVVRVAKQKNVDGFICGHVHTASNKMIDDIHYINCGDWVDSFTIVVEENNELKLLVWKNGDLYEY